LLVGNTRRRGRGQQEGEGQDESCSKKTRFHGTLPKGEE
jgi:hypothetical protein